MAHKHKFRHMYTRRGSAGHDDILIFDCDGCNRNYEIFRASWVLLLTGDLKIDWI